MPTTRILQRLTSPLALIALTLVSGEWLLRAVDFEYAPAGERGEVWNPEEDRAIRHGTNFNQFDPKSLWSPIPGARLPWTKDERINAAGYRGPLVETARQPGTFRIVTLGSCAAFGRGVPYEATYSAELERLLRERGVKAEVLAGGVAGSTIQQGLARYREVFRGYKPDLVISSFSGYREHELAPRFQCDAQRIKSWSEHPERAPSHAKAWSPRRDLRIVQLPIWMLRVLDGTYWEEREVEFKERRKLPLAKTNDASLVRRVSMSEFQESLTKLENEVRSDGGQLLLLNVPNNFSQAKRSPMVQQYGTALSEFGRREGLIHVHGLEVIRRSRDGGKSVAELFDVDGFPSALSHELVAQALTDEIIAHLPELRH